ncbi:putative spermidine/putrescine transport system ATP-binding protein [Devosia crocina]|uniref:Spermidine/putrescine import ATP-binding protein PotA n=2 Tax=Devosia crocina TaxID=429728 RepID=A0A1I7MYY7_9HYPH|nr:ABC transporter ATP-binding protein [Devosia crocina]SFV27545.1 putative spermidine/putrescine transport system ATP-binding protein [Devosia crocina]
MTREQTPIVRFRGVTKTYNNFTAVQSLDLDIARGEFLTLLGPSGSGKTTTLMLLTGFETASSGTIEIDGKRIESLPAHKREIGVVFQNYALFPHMSAAENIAYPLRVRGMGRAEVEAEVARVLATVDLADKGHRRPGQLSGGQQQRVALARAMVFKPRLIVLDEPLGALDKNLREQMQEELRALHRQIGITMVFVTHDQSEALTLSDRIAVFNKGRIEQLDTPEGLYRDPCTTFVAGFIGENNLVPGRIEAVGSVSASIRLDNGRLVEADAPNRPLIGERAFLALRPERIAFAEVGDASAIPAKVKQCTYLGDCYRLDVEAEGIGLLKLKLSGTIPTPPVPGNMVQVKFSDRECRILADR